MKCNITHSNVLCERFADGSHQAGLSVVFEYQTQQCFVTAVTPYLMGRGARQTGAQHSH